MGVEYNHSIIDSSTWWLKETKGATLFNKFILSSLKVIYLGSRFLLKLALGKKRRDRIYVQKGINFKDFLYKSLKFFIKVFFVIHNYYSDFSPLISYFNKFVHSASSLACVLNIHRLEL